MTLPKVLKKRPQLLFCIDGLGALLSAFFLGVVLVRFQHLIGLPVKSLYLLSSLPVFYWIFDLYCLFSGKPQLKLKLRIIASLNLAYMLVSVGFAIYHAHTITLLGWFYILSELLIIGALVFLEFSLAKVS